MLFHHRAYDKGTCFGANDYSASWLRTSSRSPSMRSSLTPIPVGCLHDSG
ncbi:hypothetical protein AZE42_14172 [Rhizopogon vesiculosus]|uniref:Uncharacterized protein n=1 Tax=Rhizopogon vesiculosus TaxID=180088 RepID=A0A1J8PTA4_9AGAM|nr:hypothetical protein AZE42_14172 [Rhizopogon vesiculosus]